MHFKGPYTSYIISQSNALAFHSTRAFSHFREKVQSQKRWEKEDAVQNT